MSPRRRILIVAVALTVAVAGLMVWGISALHARQNHGRIGTRKDVISRLNKAGFYQLFERAEEYQVNRRKATRLAFVQDANWPEDCVVYLCSYLGSDDVCMISAEGSTSPRDEAITKSDSAALRKDRERAFNRKYGAALALRAVLGKKVPMFLPTVDPYGWHAAKDADGTYITAVNGVEIDCTVGPNWDKTSTNHCISAFASAH